MNEKPRILCPKADLPTQVRIDAVVAEFDRWVRSEAMADLVLAFDGDAAALNKSSTVDVLRWLKSFAAVWDYRKKQVSATTKEGEAARWLLKADESVAGKESLIYRAAEQLGLIGIEQTVYEQADYVLPLGGACLSNLRRCQAAQAVIEQLKTPTAVVALSGLRPISQTEREGYVDTYAPDAETEFDAISAGMCRAFGISERYKDQIEPNDNPNLCATVRHFTETYRESELYAVAAPSSVPERRANSADCFHDFFRRFAVPTGAKLINCTSQIYCTYQQVRALSFAIAYGVEFDTIGFHTENGAVNAGLSQPVNYLQEIKGTIDAMNDFVERFV